jgi:hypothetical protein
MNNNLNLSKKIELVANKSLMMCILKKSTEFVCKKINPDIVKDQIYQFGDVLTTGIICAELIHSFGTFESPDTIIDNQNDNSLMLSATTMLVAGIFYSYLTKKENKKTPESGISIDLLQPNPKVLNQVLKDSEDLKSFYHKKIPQRIQDRRNRIDNLISFHIKINNRSDEQSRSL